MKRKSNKISSDRPEWSTRPYLEVSKEAKSKAKKLVERVQQIRDQQRKKALEQGKRPLA